MQQIVGKELWLMCAMWLAITAPLTYCTSETPRASSEKSTADDCGEIGPPLWPADVTVPRPNGGGGNKLRSRSVDTEGPRMLCLQKAGETREYYSCAESKGPVTYLPAMFV